MPPLELFSVLLLAGAGLLAGLINTIVGSGSLISFPALLALGYPPVLANVTNNVGVLPGSVSGAVGYRKELRGHWRAIVPLICSALLGGVAGALLLLVLPAEVFNGIVPALIAVACVLVIAGPRIKARIAARKLLDAAADPAPENVRAEAPIRPRAGLLAATGLTGTYGGYFGAAQGVILLAILSIMLEGSMQRANAVKNVLGAAANFAAGIVFVSLTPVDWAAAGVIAAGAIVGGQVGAKLGQRIPDGALRWTIVVVGVVAIIALLMP